MLLQLLMVIRVLAVPNGFITATCRSMEKLNMLLLFLKPTILLVFLTVKVVLLPLMMMLLMN